MVTARDTLNALKWRDEALDAAVEVWYLHRGAPNDTRIVRGDAIAALHHSFFELAAPEERSAMIPYHRVMRILREGRVVWERAPGTGGDAPEGP